MPPDAGESVDALTTDQYLDELLAQVRGTTTRTGPRTADGATEPDAAARGSRAEAAEAAEVDAGVRHGAGVLRATLLRAHPSFRFEERLAARLAELAAADAWASVAAEAGRPANPRRSAAGRPTSVIPFPAAAPSIDDPLLAVVLAGRLEPSDEAAVDRASGGRSPARPLLVGGAITSAAISLVGVAWVAWRASRPGGAPMGRAARAAHARRVADLAPGIPGGPA